MVRYNIYNKGSQKLIDKYVNDFDISEAIARIMINRDISYDKAADYIRPDINKLNNPFLLTDIADAAILTLDAINKSKRIRIIGDYDIDGIMSTYILFDALRVLDALVDYQIPHRIEDGYGLNTNIINRAIDDKIDLIITCDNGVSAIDEIKLARDNGIDVIVTDHHEMVCRDDEEIRPIANYVINPKRRDDKYPFKKLCGAVVAWKFITVLFDMAGVVPHIVRDSRYMTFEGGFELLSDAKLRPVMKYLEYAAFATIGDVMELVEENRTIVKIGLDMLSNTNNCGLKSLCEHRLKSTDKISAYHVGFVLGPCINASGRLDTAAKSLELLLSKDKAKADSIAEQLVDLNEERKDLTDAGVERACAIVDDEMSDDKVLCIYMSDVHESVAGIIAGRLRERYNKPVIVLCDGEECVKGSARSIESYNMYEALNEVRDLFIKFGGHPMAAGMSLDESNVDILRKRLNDNCNLTQDDFVDIRLIDMTMSLSYITIPLVEELEALEPFGNANKKPLFAYKNAKIRQAKRIGNDKYLKFEFETDKGTISGLYFNDAKALEEEIIQSFGQEEWNKALSDHSNNISLTIMFYPSINEYRGNKSVQIILSDVVV